MNIFILNFFIISDPGRKRERRRSSEDLTDILSDLKIYLRGVASEVL